jgi:hypothetical protein
MRAFCRRAFSQSCAGHCPPRGHGTWVSLSTLPTVSFRHRQPQKLPTFFLGLYDGPPVVCSHLLARPGLWAVGRTNCTLPPAGSSARLEDKVITPSSRTWSPGESGPCIYFIETRTATHCAFAISPNFESRSASCRHLFFFVGTSICTPRYVGSSLIFRGFRLFVSS